MKRQSAIEIGVLIVLVAIGVAVRIGLEELPNFAPVAALALFSGYFFRSRVLALCTPLAVMAISDWFIGAYDWRMMTLVYGMLALPAAMGGPLRRCASLTGGRWTGVWKPASGLLTCSLGASLLFFFTTNLGTWLWFDLYERSSAGLLQCYVQALPFFRYTLAGDLFFAFALFGGYAAAASLGLVRDTATALGSTEAR